MKKRIYFYLFCFFMLFGTKANANLEVNKQAPVWVSDAHVHFVNFLQHNEDISTFIIAMNKAHVQDAMISGLSLIKKWDGKDHYRPSYYLDNNSKLYYYSMTDLIVAKAIKNLPPQEQQRLHPFICGFNPTDKNAIDHIKKMREWYPDFWQGIGEILTRHGTLTDLTEGETATANNPALDAVYDYAATNHLPVLLHSDISTAWAKQNAATASQPIYLNEIVSALEKHPQTTFIWAHAGLDRYIKVNHLIEIIDQTLAQHKNLYIDISGFTYPYIVKNGKVLPVWLALFIKYPDRIILGTDVVGDFSNYEKEMRSYRLIINSLPAEVAKKVATTNFLKLLPHYSQRI